MTLNGLTLGLILVFALAWGILGPSPGNHWWAALGRCVGCGHAKDRHSASGCNDWPGCSCGLPYGERP